MDVVILSEDGKILHGEQGELCCKTAFPSMPIGFWNDPDGSKYHDAYFDMFANIWRHGDWATLTSNDGIIIHGRSDTTLNPGGVRIGTAEIYRPVEALDEVIEALVIGQKIDNDIRIIHTSNRYLSMVASSNPYEIQQCLVMRRFARGLFKISGR